MAGEPAPEAQASSDLQEGEPVAGAETSTTGTSEEEVEINVWWPKDTGPFRRERPKPDARPQHRHPRKGRPERKPQTADGDTAARQGSRSPPPASDGRNAGRRSRSIPIRPLQSWARLRPSSPRRRD